MFAIIESVGYPKPGRWLRNIGHGYRQPLIGFYLVEAVEKTKGNSYENKSTSENIR
jgi:hypothetical protein